MKRKRIIIAVIIIILILLVLISILLKLKKDGPLYNSKTTIEVIVVKTDENSLLAMGLDSSLYSIGTKDYSNLELKKGQKLLIYFDGIVLESYPAHLSNITKIEIIEEESNVEIPENILRYCYSSIDNVNVTINELKTSGITLTITDTNEIPYKYAHSYKINKEVKNENYTGIGQIIGEDTENSTSGFTRNRIRVYLARSK